MWNLIFSLTLLLYSSQAFAQRILYTVRPKETLSNILYAHSLKPIYGRKGSLLVTLSINPELKANGNIIYPGQILILPIENSSIPLREISQEDEKDEEIIETILEDNYLASDVFVIGTNAKFFRIDAIDSKSKQKARILSKASPELHLAFHLRWDDKNTIEFTSQFEQYSLQKLNKPRTFDDESGTRLHFAMSYIHQILPKLRLGLGVRFDQELFFYAEDAQKLIVESALITKPLLNARYTLFEKKNAQIDMNLEYAYALSSASSASSIRSGSYTSIGPSFLYRGKMNSEKGIELAINYERGEQSTSLLSKREVKELMFGVRYFRELTW